VVPYNPYLSAKYNCHINVEVCASISAIKYIQEYIYKGHDHATIKLSGGVQDEIKEYLDANYVSAIEACWHVFEFNMHAESPSVYHLPVHLQDQHMVYFNAEDELDSVMEQETTKKTALTAFFEANKEGLPEAKDTLYQDFPHKFVFDKKKKKWTVRKKGTAIGWMYFSVPSQGERFYLRTLLTVVKGPESFEGL
jgi:hypothetical protein